ncbi:MAG: nucleoside deaminase [Ruminiclostridium sp.]|nr:nucleoside deaminase [Ruminiclostridium sp.]
MWSDLSYEWQTAFSEAWTAFKNGSTPIGAALFDGNGNLVTSNRNRAGEKGTLNKRTSHAEANILHGIDTSVYDLHDMILYSTMEPCPMCMGTCVMAGIRTLRFAARDPYCGFTYLKDTEPYFKTKNLDYSFTNDEMELVQLTIQGYRELRYMEQGASDKVYKTFYELVPKIKELTETLYKEKTLDKFAKEDKPFSEVYDYILSLK